MNLDDLNGVERLAIYQAIYNAIGENVSTKNPDSLRVEIDETYRQLYEQTGSKSFDVKINGEVVGTYSIKFSKDKESEESLSFAVSDVFELAKWFADNSSAEIEHRYAALNLEKFAEFYFDETGEMPEGCEIRKTIIPAVEKAYIGGALRVDGEKVAIAIKNQLPNIAGLLMGADDDWN